MDIDRKRASSHKVSQTSWTGTVLSREQLRRQLSEQKKASSPTASNSRPQTVARATYAVPQKDKTRPVDGMLEAGNITPEPGNSSKPQMGPITSALEPEAGDLDADIALFEDDEGKVKGVVELSTLRQKRLPHIKLRVICLIDVSGSMLLKGDKGRQRSKISILKSMAADIIEALEEEEDFFGVVTFGEEPRVICPLQKVSAESRCTVKEKVNSLDRDWGFSAVTDLSSALQRAIAMLSAAQVHQSLVYRNCVIVFSDGEINAGETDPQKLVHATREKIREVGTPEGVLGDLWVNVSCVTTGSHFSQSLYLLSKMCGSDAYFFIDGSRDHPEADMLVPLLLRKSACAQLVSVTVSAAHGARLLPEECSQEYRSVRRKPQQRGGGGGEAAADAAVVAYFLHDMPVGTRKTFTIALQLEDGEGRAGGRVSFSGEDQGTSPLLTLHVQYVDADGVLHNISKQLQRRDVLNMLSPRKSMCVQVVAKHAVSSLRQLFQSTCREVALILERNDNSDDNPEALTEEVIAAVKSGKEKLFATAAKVLPHLDDAETLCEFQALLSALQANLQRLQSTVTTQYVRAGRVISSGGRGAGWQLSKALASAVARQLPTTSHLLLKPQVVCPLLLPPPPPQHQKDQAVSGSASGECASVRTQALSLYVLGAAREEDAEELGTKGESASNRLLLAAGAVATSLADVLKMVEKGGDFPA